MAAWDPELVKHTPVRGPVCERCDLSPVAAGWGGCTCVEDAEDAQHARGSEIVSRVKALDWTVILASLLVASESPMRTADPERFDRARSELHGLIDLVWPDDEEN